MAHNTRPLKRAQDGVAPQYYNRTVDEYEVLEGTAGANHVVIYGPDGQPASLATETKLEAVRTLVEDLKSELILVKANQLSGDQKVQLSGTIVEQLVASNFTVTAGATVAINPGGNLINMKSDGGYSRFAIGVRASAAHEFEILVSHMLENGQAVHYRDVEYTPTTPVDVGGTKVIDAKASKIRIDIRNKDTSSRTYDVYITKMR